MPRRTSPARRHPAVVGAILHGGASLVLLVGVALAVAGVPAGAPRSLAPLLLGAYIVFTVAVMSAGVLVTIRARARSAAEPRG